MRTIYQQRSAAAGTPFPLGRHVRHDSASRRYVFPTTGLSVVSARHTRRILVLDQGSVGACTGFAGIGCLATDPYFDTLAAAFNTRVQARPRQHIYTLDDAGALALYSDATQVDDYPGQYPPEDTGSDGLTIAKVLTARGEIAGYTHTFSLDAALKALGVTPFITGTTWLGGMFSPDPDGRVNPTGSSVGGHEYVADGIDADAGRVWFTNSWGPGWGLAGRFWMSFADYGALLADRGDVTIFTPLTEPPPAPTPDPGEQADADLAAALRRNRWVDRWHLGDNRRTAQAAKRWLTAKGL